MLAEIRTGCLSNKILTLYLLRHMDYVCYTHTRYVYQYVALYVNDPAVWLRGNASDFTLTRTSPILPEDSHERPEFLANEGQFFSQVRIASSQNLFRLGRFHPFIGHKVP